MAHIIYIGFLIVVILVLAFNGLRKTFKIASYETKLENRNVDIYDVKNMPFYKLWIN